MTRLSPTMRKEQIGNAALYLADAFEVMPKLGEVDCIITDPPYNAKTHRGARSAKSLAASRIDFDSLTEEQFIEFCGNAVAQAKRWVVMSCAWQHAALLEKSGAPLAAYSGRDLHCRGDHADGGQHLHFRLRSGLGGDSAQPHDRGTEHGDFDGAGRLAFHGRIYHVRHGHAGRGGAAE